jgi:hypothetical protein
MTRSNVLVPAGRKKKNFTFFEKEERIREALLITDFSIPPGKARLKWYDPSEIHAMIFKSFLLK